MFWLSPPPPGWESVGSVLRSALSLGTVKPIITLAGLPIWRWGGFVSDRHGCVGVRTGVAGLAIGKRRGGMFGYVGAGLSVDTMTSEERCETIRVVSRSLQGQNGIIHVVIYIRMDQIE